MLLFLAQFSATLAAPAEPRFALLIGNRSYTDAVGPLKNPPNDIALMKAALQRVGFLDENIRVAHDADRVTMLDTFDAFVADVRRGGTGAISFFYYSGHGAANDQRENFLIPTDVVDPAATGFWRRSVALDELITGLKTNAPEAKHFVIFDACRNNLKVGGGKGKKSLTQAKGFEPVREIPGGMLIAFATEQGELASDVGDRAGPYASMLAEEIIKPDVEAFVVFRRVQTRLMNKIEQAPWMHHGPMGEVYFARSWPIEIALNVPQAPPPASQTGCEGVEVAFGKSDTQCVRPGGGMGFKDCPLCPEMVVVPRGEYLMGEDAGAGKPEESPKHKISLSRHFAVGKYEVTTKEWMACVTDGGCAHKPVPPICKQGDCPITNVSWSQIVSEYLPWLSKKAERPYRLLSEAEWEYVARAGSVKRYAFGDDEANLGKYAWYGGNAKWTHIVGDKHPNVWGLHDMHGNVAEIVDDCWNASYADKPEHLRASGAPWKVGDCRFIVSRGGSWHADAGLVRSAARSKLPTDATVANTGFRVTRAITP